MATYAIGDLQGCFRSLESLLAKIDFNRAKDRLWFVGDLVNRGPQSLECLRFVKDLGESATVVLGNHDLHLLAVAEGICKAGKGDTLASILDASDREILLDWLRHRQLLHADGAFVMIHAGLPPQWDFSLAKKNAHEIEAELRGKYYRVLLENMYGNEPRCWRDGLPKADRVRVAINALTRMRVVSDTGEMDLCFNGGLIDLPTGMSPWYEKTHPSLSDKTLIAGHWSALGLQVTPHFIGIDTGCVWGRELTAVRLDDRTIFQVPCAEISPANARN